MEYIHAQEHKHHETNSQTTQHFQEKSTKGVTQTQRRPELPTATLTWHASKIQSTETPPKVHPQKGSPSVAYD